MLRVVSRTGCSDGDAGGTVEQLITLGLHALGVRHDGAGMVPMKDARKCVQLQYKVSKTSFPGHSMQ